MTSPSIRIFLAVWSTAGHGSQIIKWLKVEETPYIPNYYMLMRNF